MSSIRGICDAAPAPSGNHRRSIDVPIDHRLGLVDSAGMGSGGVAAVKRSGISFRAIIHPRYRWKLTENHIHRLDNCQMDDVGALKWATLKCGQLTIFEGYAWDGASGPALDSMSMARASLIHDVLYQLIAADMLPKKPWKLHADRELRRIMREDGASWIRSQYVYAAVRVFGRARDKYRP